MILITGCQSGQTVGSLGDPLLAAPRQTIGVRQLAGRLGLDVASSGSCSATLRNTANTVTVFKDPGGRVYVNGLAIGPTGGITCSNGALLLPIEFESAIRRRLRATPPESPREKPTEKQAKPVRKRRIVIDPGHGGKDPGAIGVLGTHEKVINLKVAIDVAARLRRIGHDVHLTRSTDVFIELNDRAALANRLKADLFVSIHANHNPRPTFRGYTVFVANKASAASKACGQSLVTALQRTGIRNLGLRRMDFRVLVRTHCPAVLVEMGHLSNRAEARLLEEMAFQKTMTEAITSGIVSSLPRL
jgi:N-acetylmuramoyl-L-alanine amidase